MFKLAALTAATVMVVGAGGAMASAPMIDAGATGQATLLAATETPTTAPTTAAASTGTTTTATPIAVAAPSSTAKGVTSTATIGTKHGLTGTVTLTHHPDGGGQLKLLATGIPVEDMFTVSIYRGTATPVTMERRLFSWRRDDARRQHDGSITIDLTEAQVAALHEARAEQGLLVRIVDGSKIGDAILTAK